MQIFHRIRRLVVTYPRAHAEHPDMVKREQPVIDLTACEDDGEPAAQRVKVEEPDHLLCPITRVMFRDPVMLMESGHTYEREDIERHLGIKRTDPRTNVPIKSTRVMTNTNTRMAVEAWLADNPGITPYGWETREVPAPAQHPQPGPARHAPPMEYYLPDLDVLREWRESCPELRDMWREDDHGNWEGIIWSDGRVTRLTLTNKQLSGQLPRLEGLTSLQTVDLNSNQLSGPIPEKLFEGLTLLREVGLSNNQLSGSIPEKLFEGLTSLERVLLCANQLTGPIPEKLFEGLTSLQNVNLQDNQLTGPPTSCRGRSLRSFSRV